jgi:hypothetical protein
MILNICIALVPILTLIAIGYWFTKNYSIFQPNENLDEHDIDDLDDEEIMYYVNMFDNDD